MKQKQAQVQQPHIRNPRVRPVSSVEIPCNLWTQKFLDLRLIDSMFVWYLAKVFCTKCLVSHEFQANLASHISPELLQARVRAEAPEASEDENEHVQGNVSESEDTSDISISTFNSADEAALQELERNERGVEREVYGESMAKGIVKLSYQHFHIWNNSWGCQSHQGTQKEQMFRQQYNLHKMQVLKIAGGTTKCTNRSGTLKMQSSIFIIHPFRLQSEMNDTVDDARKTHICFFLQVRYHRSAFAYREKCELFWFSDLVSVSVVVS